MHMGEFEVQRNYWALEDLPVANWLEVMTTVSNPLNIEAIIQLILIMHSLLLADDTATAEHDIDWRTAFHRVAMERPLTLQTQWPSTFRHKAFHLVPRGLTFPWHLEYRNSHRQD
jgi:hypothetical protein